ncbi:uncharacterized protein K452DRAFT_155328 [Aplosporella prunicola CBS 121167]|uniref:Uncharacterized protein n=1 Tax=Aplosporella prunicola CBS 121167 TaxID=1176127 RepID=A0A6A6BLG7_9PEZI|nr:uncharacterized protein K452DRAFT_155328 [Aplosporella prunicola CBS 121167]KAF2144243.1 hypothetical protein K452DRAFT_155328 [Aplosporella prunicola CBS 121167]
MDGRVFLYVCVCSVRWLSTCQKTTYFLFLARYLSFVPCVLLCVISLASVPSSHDLHICTKRSVKSWL